MLPVGLIEQDRTVQPKLPRATPRPAVATWVLPDRRIPFDKTVEERCYTLFENNVYRFVMVMPYVNLLGTKSCHKRAKLRHCPSEERQGYLVEEENPAQARYRVVVADCQANVARIYSDGEKLQALHLRLPIIFQEFDVRMGEQAQMVVEKIPFPVNVTEWAYPRQFSDLTRESQDLLTIIKGIFTQSVLKGEEVIPGLFPCNIRFKQDPPGYYFVGLEYEETFELYSLQDKIIAWANKNPSIFDFLISGFPDGPGTYKELLTRSISWKMTPIDLSSGG